MANRVHERSMRRSGYRMIRLGLGLGLTLLPALFVHAADPTPHDSQTMISAPVRHALKNALSFWQMTESDLGFEKDVGEPDLVLSWTRTLLQEPLTLFAMGEEARRSVVDESLRATWLSEILDVDGRDSAIATNELEGRVDIPIMPGLNVHSGLSHFLVRVEGAARLQARALHTLTQEDRSFLVGAWMSGMFELAGDPEMQARFRAEGVTPSTLDFLLSFQEALDTSPLMERWLEVAGKVDRFAMLMAGLGMDRAVAALVDSVAGVQDWPQQVIRWETPQGAVIIGTPGRDRYEGRALLILDPGGDDLYEGEVGVANDLVGQAFSAVIDLDGNDVYRSERLAGLGSAWLGVSVIHDQAGRDVYQLQGSGLAHAVGGYARLRDAGGDDLYEATALAQACAVLGVGWLEDDSGNDTYRLGAFGQAASGLFGAAVLLDHEGADVYVAGGLKPDHERNQDRYLSLAQGFSIGDRPDTGGGVALLMDLAGNDVYRADIYGQGVGYYYALGMLVDVAGNDSYTMYQYGQGAGIHLSGGLLADDAGNDFYASYILAQGAAHDYAVGALVDRDGNDTYTADHHSQGRALNNALAFLVDEAGDDAYFGRQPDQCQGVGNNGGFRDYGSLAFLLDLGGYDRYTCPATNGMVLLRPDFGVVLDREESQP